MLPVVYAAARCRCLLSTPRNVDCCLRRHVACCLRLGTLPVVYASARFLLSVVYAALLLRPACCLRLGTLPVVYATARHVACCLRLGTLPVVYVSARCLLSTPRHVACFVCCLRLGVYFRCLLSTPRRCCLLSTPRHVACCLRLGTLPVVYASAFVLPVVYARRSRCHLLIICVKLLYARARCLFICCLHCSLGQAFSCGHLLYICVFHIARLLWPVVYARLSQAFSCGHLLHICVFHIARWSRRSLVAIYCICVFRCSTPGVLLLPFIEYLCFRHCSFEPGVLFVIYCYSYCSLSHVLLWPFIEYLCFSYCSLEPGVLLLPFINICVFHIARLSQAFSCGHLLIISIFRISVFHIAR